jgi:hypothetical protein
MFKKTFSESGPFKALYAAQKWLSQNGYSYGSTSRGSPVGVMKGDVVIAKWRNLTKQEIDELGGRLTGDTREGPVTLILKESPAS